MIKKIGVINYGAGNLMSISKALQFLGLDVEIIHRKTKKNYDMLILPGVGNFESAMNTLKKYDLDEYIINFVSKQRPLLGICLGIQLLFEKSEEAKNTLGLGLLKGEVKKFRVKNLPVPHMCWNLVNFVKEEKILLERIKKQEFFYFVHSYYPKPYKKEYIFGTTKYASVEFCSMIVKENIVATQFHLEKSGQEGLKLLRNIINYFNKLN